MNEFFDDRYLNNQWQSFKSKFRLDEYPRLGDHYLAIKMLKATYDFGFSVIECFTLIIEVDIGLCNKI